MFRRIDLELEEITKKAVAMHNVHKKLKFPPQLCDCGCGQMSKYHKKMTYTARSWNSENFNFIFLMHPDTLSCIGKYFAVLLDIQYIEYTYPMINLFEGIEIWSSDNVEEGAVLAIKKINKVFP